MAGGQHGFAGLVTGAEAITMLNPKETLAIFACIIVISMTMEHVFDVFKSARSPFKRKIFGVVSEEVMLLGVISILLLFVQSLSVNMPERWFSLFEWAHFVLFFMMMFLISTLVGSVFAIRLSMKRWVEWEVKLPANGAKPHNLTKRSEKMFHLRCVFHREVEMLFPEAKERARDIRFMLYLLRLQNSTVVEMIDLDTISWVILVCYAGINALRQVIVNGDAVHITDEHRLWSVLSFVLLMGYTPLIIFVGAVYKLHTGFTQYIEETSNKDLMQFRGRAKDFVDPKRFLIRRSLGFTFVVIKACTLVSDFYLAVWIMGYSYSTATKISWGAFIICLSLFPIFVFVALLPWTTLLLTVMNSMGPHIRANVIERMIDGNMTGFTDEVDSNSDSGDSSDSEDDEMKRIEVEEEGTAVEDGGQPLAQPLLGGSKGGPLSPTDKSSTYTEALLKHKVEVLTKSVQEKDAQIAALKQQQERLKNVVTQKVPMQAVMRYMKGGDGNEEEPPGGGQPASSASPSGGADIFSKQATTLKSRYPATDY